jgi:GT2 family glycosyltransferase
VIEVSFVVIAMNEARSIARTLSSITALIGLPTYEIIFVNDGSSDETLKIVQVFALESTRIKVMDLQPNRGRGGARKAGCDVAQGDLIAFVDGDIVLPPDWWLKASTGMGDADACGGIAVPDGDVSFVHRVLPLVPRIRGHTTSVTGSNGLFRQSVFDVVSFDPTKRNGEDVDLGFQMRAAGLTAITIVGLTVQHFEHKSFVRSAQWLWESGLGATAQWRAHPALRIPDLATIAFMGALLGAALLLLTSLWWGGPLIILAVVLGTSAVHLHTKFHLSRTPASSVVSWFVHSPFIFLYLLGRVAGLLVVKQKPSHE